MDVAACCEKAFLSNSFAGVIAAFIQSTKIAVSLFVIFAVSFIDDGHDSSERHFRRADQ